MEDERITFTELGRRLGLSQQRISQLADTDPDFPARYKAGPAWQVSWAEAQAWDARRAAKLGRTPAHRPTSGPGAGPT